MQLYSVIVVVLWTILSLTVVLLMEKETNRRIAEESANQISDKTEIAIIVKPYKKDNRNFIMLFVVTVISAVCAWFVSQSVISVFFCIEMGLCYTATLGAAIVDFKLKKIPNVISLILIISGIIMIILQSFFIENPVLYLISSIFGCFISFCILSLAGKFSKGGIGMGDIKLISAIGLTVGIQAVFVSMITALISCLIVMIYFEFKRKYVTKSTVKETKKNKMAFAPFLYLGFVLTILLTLY